MTALTASWSKEMSNGQARQHSSSKCAGRQSCFAVKGSGDGSLGGAAATQAERMELSLELSPEPRRVGGLGPDAISQH